MTEFTTPVKAATSRKDEGSVGEKIVNQYHTSSSILGNSITAITLIETTGGFIAQPF